jgi:hypothetical protein
VGESLFDYQGQGRRSERVLHTGSRSAALEIVPPVEAVGSKASTWAKGL